PFRRITLQVPLPPVFKPPLKTKKMIRHRAVLSSRDIKGIGLILWDKPGNIAMTAFEKDFFRDLSRDQEGAFTVLSIGPRTRADNRFCYLCIPTN
ncbi:hypothetical protein, partial [Porphyromonas loveana]